MDDSMTRRSFLGRTALAAGGTACLLTRAALSTGGRPKSKFLCAAFDLGHARR